MAKNQTKYLIDEKGQKTAVVIPLNDYQELLEDIHDLAIVAERKDEPTINFDTLKKRLKADGFL
jgi:PHD/YefM family antitoxin component YafN of YafNO toxin-antitoxin module